MTNVLYKIEIQYKRDEWARPEDVIQDEPLEFKEGEYCPIPNVGDCVIYKYDGGNVMRKVLYRTFSYHQGSSQTQEALYCNIHLIVTDVSKDESAARLKS